MDCSLPHFSPSHVNGIVQVKDHRFGGRLLILCPYEITREEAQMLVYHDVVNKQS